MVHLAQNGTIDFDQPYIGDFQRFSAFREQVYPAQLEPQQQRPGDPQAASQLRLVAGGAGTGAELRGKPPDSRDGSIFFSFFLAYHGYPIFAGLKRNQLEKPQFGGPPKGPLETNQPHTTADWFSGTRPKVIL